MNPLINFYRQLLVSAGATIEGDEIHFNGTPVSIMVKKKQKQLVLPTQDRLKNSDWSKTVAFHPTSESVVSGQSEVINFLINLIGLKLFDQVQKLSATIVEACSDEEKRNTFTSKQLRLFQKFNTIDKATIQLYISIANKTTGIQGEHPLFSIRLERGGEIAGIAYNRRAKLIPYILTSEERLCGVKPISKRSAENIRELYRVVLPEVTEYGTNTNNFPYFIALLTLYKGAAEHLNKLKSILGKLAPTPEINLTWTNDLEEINTLAKLIPQSLEGNIGISITNKDTGLKHEPSENTQASAESPFATVNKNKISLATSSNHAVESPDSQQTVRGSNLVLGSRAAPPVNGGQRAPETPTIRSEPAVYTPPQVVAAPQPAIQTPAYYQNNPIHYQQSNPVNFNLQPVSPYAPAPQPPVVQPPLPPQQPTYYQDPRTGQYMMVVPAPPPSAPPAPHAPLSLGDALVASYTSQAQQSAQYAQRYGNNQLVLPHQQSRF